MHVPALLILPLSAVLVIASPTSRSKIIVRNTRSELTETREVVNQANADFARASAVPSAQLKRREIQKIENCYAPLLFRPPV